MRQGSQSAGMMWEIPRKLGPPSSFPSETQTSARSYELFQ